MSIARELAGIYGSDIPKALASAEAAEIRFNNQLRAMADLGQDVSRTLFVDFESGLRNGKSAWEAFRDAGVNALGRIADKLAQMAADNLWRNAFGGSGGGGLLSLFGIGGGSGAGGGLDLGGADVINFAAANGGSFGPGWGVVGERGRELIKVHQGGGVTVFPNSVTNSMLPGFANGGSLSPNGSTTLLSMGGVSAPVSIHIDATGADAAGLARVSTQLEKLKAELPHRVVAVVNDAKRRRVL